MQNPQHIAIIMDGNGRWAKLRKRPRLFGHIKGARVAKKITTFCVSQKIQALTLYAFSSENWLRPEVEVKFLMFLLQRYLKKEIKTLIKQNVRFRVIGNRRKLSPEVLTIIETTERETSHCTGLNLTFAISYGSKEEIIDATRSILKKCLEQNLTVDEVSPELFQNHLYTSFIQDPDLIIRTSGEKRLSNFLLWQAAYSEFYFCDTLWPDFNEIELQKAMDDFKKRSRRFGLVNNELRSN